MRFRCERTQSKHTHAEATECCVRVLSVPLTDCCTYLRLTGPSLLLSNSRGLQYHQLVISRQPGLRQCAGEQMHIHVLTTVCRIRALGGPIFQLGKDTLLQLGVFILRLCILERLIAHLPRASQQSARVATGPDQRGMETTPHLVSGISSASTSEFVATACELPNKRIRVPRLRSDEKYHTRMHRGPATRPPTQRARTHGTLDAIATGQF